MPLPTCLKYAEQIVNLLVGCQKSDEATVHRLVGPAGIGKSHAALLTLVCSMALYRSAVVFVTLDPLKLINNPKKIVEQLVLQMCHVHLYDVVECLLDIYIKAKIAEDPELCLELSFEAIVVCHRMCFAKGILFIHILDDENVLHLESRSDTMLKLLKHMLSTWAADMKILIVSPPLHEDPYVRHYADVQLHFLPPVPDLVGATATCMYDTFLESSYFCDTQKNNLIAWQSFWGSKS